MNLLTTITILAVAIIAILVTIAHKQAHRLTHSSQYSRHKHYSTLASISTTAQERHPHLKPCAISLVTQDGVRLAAHYTPSHNGAAIILSHGYKMSSHEMLPIAELFALHGYGILIQDQRAHGMSHGEQISFGRDEWYDFDAAVNFLEQQLNIDTIGLFGNSMGGALSLCYAARDPRIKAIVAQSPYASIGHSIKKGVKQFTKLPPVPFAPLVHFMAQRKLKIDSSSLAPLNAMAKIYPRPVLLMMGGQDRYVEPKGIFSLQKASGNSAELWYENDLDHVEFYEKHPAEFERQIMDFYGKHLLCLTKNS